MKKNVGRADSIIRLILAAVFAILYFTGTVTGTWGIVLLVLAVIMVFTAFTGFCLLYVPFGIKTCPLKEEEQ